MKIVSDLLAVALTVLFVFPAHAQEEKKQSGVARWVQGTPWQFDGQLPMSHTKILAQVGEKGVQDEYLSPISHRGVDARLTYLTDFAGKPNRTWHLYQEVTLSASKLKNPANGTEMYGAALDYALGPSWRVIRHRGFALDLAPLAALYIGANFKTSNTNNIGNAKGHFGFDGQLRAIYQLPSTVLPASFSYSARLPLLQMAFHPGFGQSYYDFISGQNGATLPFRFGSLHNTIGITQRLLIDLPIRHLTLTVGVSQAYFRQRLNHTTYKSGNWGAVLGVSFDLFSLSGNRSGQSRQITNTLYTNP
ncbi:MAG: hypothetical protein Q4E10_01275 [Porphyromonas sp.]|nr:hypothetical protein [Porphyromonas sp.]